MMTKNRMLEIDCRTLTSPELVHAYIAKQFHFADHYGSNLDALTDSLGDVLLEHKVTLRWKDTPTSKTNVHMQELRKVIKDLVV
jgi:RNAse (barnase) inhibitor barstar